MLIMKPVPIGRILSVLEKDVARYNPPVMELVKAKTGDPFRILVGTILSARTNDKVTSKVCATLFRKVRSPSDLEKLSLKQVEQLIMPINFYRNKARYLKALPSALKGRFNSRIPHDVDSLTELPGVGRKTANLVSSLAFGRHAICVDTHVHRICNRLGYLSTSSPYETEMALRKKLPKKYWRRINLLLVSHGQNICRPVVPRCSECTVRRYCSHIDVSKSK